MSGLEIDFETKSAVDLKSCGVYVYMADASTAPLMASYSIDGGPVRRWRPPEPCPADIRNHVLDGGIISAHNAAFERLLWQMVLTPRYGWPRAALEQFRCTAATAAALGLPRDLGGLGAALGLDVQKDTTGKSLIRLFSLPRRDGAFNSAATHPAEFERFHDYCDDDVRAEAGADRRMVPLSDDEQSLWHIDQRINDRGIRIDRASAVAALNLANKSKGALDAEMRQLTGGHVKKCSEVAKLVEWIGMQGVELGSAAKAELTDALLDETPPKPVRRAIELRQEAAKTSVQKLVAMLNRAGADDRVRGSFLFCAAGTGRWSSLGVQWQNMPRPRAIFDDAHLDKAALFEAIRTESPDILRFMYGDELGRPLHLISDALRSFIWAGPGNDLIQADYSGIEGAVAAWFAGEDWKVEALFEIMADPSLPDMYRRTAAGIMGLTTDVITKKHPLRQSVGKTSELSCFGPDTPVLTDNGIKPIVEVLTTDKVWDGGQWVAHSGLIERSARPVVDVDGIAVTPDHLIWTGQRWMPAQQLVSNASCLFRALATGSESLPFVALFSAPLAASFQSAFSARAGRLRTKLQSAISEKALARAATNARKSSAGRPERNISATMTSFPTTTIATGYLGASLRALTDAQIQRTAATRTMAAGASASIGGTIDAHSSSISSRFQGGTSQASSWIGKTSTAAMRPAISGSSPEPRTQKTSASHEKCKPGSSNSSAKSLRSMPVYDLLNAGPKHRFTVFSNSGALIVHNCQYQGGVSAFYAMARNYGVDLNAVFPAVWEAADAERRERAVKRYEKCLKRKDSKADVLSREAWIACEIIKVGWRATNPAIAEAWKLLEAGIREAISTGAKVDVLKCSYVVAHGFLWCRLPSGRCLAYANPKLKDQVWAKPFVDGEWLDAEVMDREIAEALQLKGKVKIEGETSPKPTVLGVDSATRKFVRYGLYGGLAFENIIQAIARDLLANGIRKAEGAGYPVIAHVHDEIISEIPRGTGDLKAFEKLICELPAWAAGLPLTAGGWRGKRYRKD